MFSSVLAMRERQNAFHADEALMSPCVADENVHVHEIFGRMANTSSDPQHKMTRRKVKPVWQGLFIYIYIYMFPWPI